jgi:hypothetical protein
LGFTQYLRVIADPVLYLERATPIVCRAIRDPTWFEIGMQHALPLLTALAVGLVGSAAAAARPAAPPAARPAVILAGLQLRDGAPEPSPPRAKAPPPARMRAAPEPLPPAAEPRNPVDDAVEEAVRQQLAGGVPPATGADIAAQGSPPSAAAKRALETIARAAGLDVGQVASVANTPRDQAQFLIEELLDPKFGETYVRGRYGTAGAVAAEGYRRMRDVYQILDLNAAQKQAVVAVVERALRTLGVGGQIENPNYEMIDVDPGPRANRARFETAIAASAAVARCLRPIARSGDRFYLIEIPRGGAWLGGGACREAWSGPSVAARSAPAGASDSGSAGASANTGSNAPRPRGPNADAVEVSPLAPDGRTESAAPPTAAPGAPGAPPGAPPDGGWKYIVTDGPQGPVVRRAPAR